MGRLEEKTRYLRFSFLQNVLDFLVNISFSFPRFARIIYHGLLHPRKVVNSLQSILPCKQKVFVVFCREVMKYLRQSKRNISALDIRCNRVFSERCVFGYGIVSFIRMPLNVSGSRRRVLTEIGCTGRRDTLHLQGGIYMSGITNVLGVR